jgi:hypothetical protein
MFRGRSHSKLMLYTFSKMSITHSRYHIRLGIRGGDLLADELIFFSFNLYANYLIQSTLTTSTQYKLSKGKGDITLILEILNFCLSRHPFIH